MQNVIFFLFLFQFSLTVPCVELFPVLIHIVDLGVNCVDACCVSPVTLPFHLVGVSDPTRLRREKKLKYSMELSAGSYCVGFANCVI